MQVNSEIWYHGHTYRVLSMDPPNVSIIRQGATGDAFVVKLSDLFSDPHFRLINSGVGALKGAPAHGGFSNREAHYPLHTVELDHIQLDIDVIDNKTGYVMGRPWVTLGIDLFSRAVWCLHVSFESPSENVVRKAIQQGLLSKHSREKFGTTNEWEVCGIPSTVCMENGSEFRDVEVRRIVTETLGSTVRHRPVTSPRLGSLIDRLFGKLNVNLVHQVEGSRDSAPAHLGAYDSETSARLSLNEISAILTRHIVNIYHVSPTRGLTPNGDTPMV